MNKTLFMITILLSLAIPIAPTFAETVKHHMNGKIAYATLANGSFYVEVTVFELKSPYTLRMITFALQDTTNGICIIEQKELAPTELMWNSGACELATEIAGSSLTIEWTACESCLHEHTNKKIDVKDPTDVSMHQISTIKTRNAEVTLDWKGSTMFGDGQLWQANIMSLAKFSEDPYPPSPP